MSDDLITGPVPLPDVQVVFLDQDFVDYEYPEHVERKYPEPDAFVSWHCFRALADLDRDTVERAVRIVLSYHDGLRSRLVKRDGRWTQHLASPDRAGTPLAWHDLSGLSEGEQSDAVQAAFTRGLSSLSLADGPVMSCVYLRTPPQGMLFLFYNHVIVDWLSAEMLADDFHTALEALRTAKPVSLPPKTTSIRAWGERVEAILRDGSFTDDVRRLVAHKRAWPAVPVGPLPLDYTSEKADCAVGDEVEGRLDAATTGALAAAANRSGVRLLDLLQTGLARTIAPWAGLPALPMCIVVHGRDQVFDDIDLSHTVGSFAMGLLDVVSPDAAPRPSPWADPRLRFAQVLLNFSRGLEREHESDGTEPYVSIYDRYDPQVSLNFRGRVDSFEPEAPLLVPVASEAWRDTRIRAVSKALDCLVALEERQLTVTWKFSPRYYRRGTIELLVESYLSELTTLAKG